jgi:putative phosphoribosyl transferase
VNKDWLKQTITAEKQEAVRRLTLYRKGMGERNFENKTVILVDDGVATGYTMRAAIALVKKQKPTKMIVAVPHGARESLEIIQREVDELVALEKPLWYPAVGVFYENFPQVNDEEVIALLTKALREQSQ